MLLVHFLWKVQIPLTLVRGLPRGLFAVESVVSSLLVFCTTLLLVFVALCLSLELVLGALSLTSSHNFLSSSLSLLELLFVFFNVLRGEHFGGSDLQTTFNGKSSSLDVDEHLLHDSELELLSETNAFFFLDAGCSFDCVGFGESSFFFLTDGLGGFPLFLGAVLCGIAAILSFRPVSQEVTEKCGLRAELCLDPEHSHSLPDVSLLELCCNDYNKIHE